MTNQIHLHSFDNLHTLEFRHQVRKRDKNICVVTPTNPNPKCKVVSIVPPYLLTPASTCPLQPENARRTRVRRIYHHLIECEPAWDPLLRSMNLERNLGNHLNLSSELARAFKNLDMWFHYRCSNQQYYTPALAPVNHSSNRQRTPTTPSRPPTPPPRRVVIYDTYEIRFRDPRVHKRLRHLTSGRRIGILRQPNQSPMEIFFKAHELMCQMVDDDDE